MVGPSIKMPYNFRCEVCFPFILRLTVPHTHTHHILVQTVIIEEKQRDGRHGERRRDECRTNIARYQFRFILLDKKPKRNATMLSGIHSPPISLRIQVNIIRATHQWHTTRTVRHHRRSRTKQIICYILFPDNDYVAFDDMM